MKATIVIDNIENSGIQGEWGLCIYIEYENRVVLLDVGASDLFAQNAAALGLSLNKVDFAVLSHAHFDHANGMATFFNINSSANFYMRESCRENCYSFQDDVEKYIGIHPGFLEKYRDRIVWVANDHKLDDGIYLIPHKSPNLEKTGLRERLYVKDGDSLMPDNFSHEQSLVFETDAGLVVFNSCSHGGPDVIIDEIKRTFPEKNISAFIGGFHLFNSPNAVVCDFAKKLRDSGVQTVYTGHCTGDTAYGILKEELGDTVHQFHVGVVINL